MRGEPQDAVRSATLRGRQFEEQQDIQNAIAAYEEAVGLLAAISGTVKNEAGGAIEGATVTVRPQR
jgi:hypothetical protein